ncbi:hypothetical protein A2415_02935 [candidate division WWE3 bacterium RIFOXYC1_FULL_39_7]|uniref:PABS domain-containing protein n=2 Tax=Katanobacteria TaxID=422282 RepID=A0A1F4X8M1_UNCKA|nr:MAG: hypothetical protein A2415_02935 [candidate division WWE3 bacterium RIFOXYC1_FULL_39_7]OGC77989.1 MAG: hypothetical protein A2619_02780 [candidate division WWE3 bacterium RIFOXYD1_FULL_39_9]
MVELTALIKSWFWFLKPSKVLFKGTGIYSNIKVTRRGDRTNLYTGKNYLQTSVDNTVKPYGSYSDWFLAAPWLSGKFDGKIDSLLVLGLAGGTIVKDFNRYYSINKIAAVEIDPLIIELGKKYFELNDSNLTTINADAGSYFSATSEIYDLIIMDIFKENVFDITCQSKGYFQELKKHLSAEGIVFINKLKSDPANIRLSADLKEIFKNVITLQIQDTLFFAATDSLSAPTTRNGVQDIFITASKFNPDLKYFNHINPRSIGIV